jgi:hypothetical protein
MKKKDVWRSEWHEVTNTEAHQITGSTLNPGQVFPFPTSDLPTQLQKLPGLYTSFISGYGTASVSPEKVIVLGEVAAVREGDGKGKGYVWAFGVSGSGVYVNGPYKFFDGHHFDRNGPIPVEKLFGNVPSYPSPPAATSVPTVPIEPSLASARKKAVFHLFNATAVSVYVSGDFNGWAISPMNRREDGFWEATLDLAPGRYEYKFVVDGVWQHDATCADLVQNAYGTQNSVMTIME